MHVRQTSHKVLTHLKDKGQWYICLAVLSAVATAAAIQMHHAAALGEKPNVLIILADDLNELGMQYMPKTKQWFVDGMHYTNNRVAISSCCPSRSSLYTARYPHNNGIKLQTNGPSFDKEYSLAKYAKTAGYQTGIAGKFLTTWPKTTLPPYFDNNTVIWGGYYDYFSRVQGVGKQQSKYSTTFLGEEVRRHVAGYEAQDSKPWLEVYTPQAMHIAGGNDSLAIPETQYANTYVGNCVQAGEADRTDKPPYMSWVTRTPASLDALCKSQARSILSLDDQVDLIMK